MTISTDSSSALSWAGNQSSDNNQRHFTHQQDGGPSSDQDTVRLSGQIIAGLSRGDNSEERIASLKLQYETGTYEPSWQELAGRILDIHL